MLQELSKNDKLKIYDGLNYSFTGFQVNIRRRLSSFIFNYYAPTGRNDL